MPDFRPLVIRLRDAEWDLASRERLQFLLAAATDRPQVYIEMSDVTYIDAACLGKLARMQNERLRKAGLGPAAFIVPSARVRELFNLVRFDETWPIFNTLDEALSNESQHEQPSYRAAS